MNVIKLIFLTSRMAKFLTMNNNTNILGEKYLHYIFVHSQLTARSLH